MHTDIRVYLRFQEYVSGEDPFVGYHMAAAVVQGIQSQGVIANVKHFVNNNQETNRNAVSENVDERTEFEIYYPPFEGASNAGLGSIMWCVRACVRVVLYSLTHYQITSNNTMHSTSDGTLQFLSAQTKISLTRSPTPRLWPTHA